MSDSSNGIVVDHKESGNRYAIKEDNFNSKVHRKVRDLRPGETPLGFTHKFAPTTSETPQGLEDPAKKGNQVMPITQWNPATKISRGNISVGVVETIVDIDAPKLTELTTGLGLDCSIQTFNGTSSTDSEALDWLCSPASEQIPGNTTHTIDDLVIKGTGQADADLISGLNIGDKVYLWRRDGISHDTAPATGQFVWVWEAVITSIDPLEANNTFTGITAHIVVSKRTEKPVAIVA